MPGEPGRAFILMSCACAIFWPGAFIFGFPGVMRQHWQQAFNVYLLYTYLLPYFLVVSSIILDLQVF